MWNKIALFVLKYRLPLLILIAAITTGMTYEAKQVQLTYNFAKVIPVNNPKYIDYLNFKKKFGEDGNVLVIGVQPKNLFDLKFFNEWSDLADNLKKINGVLDVVSINKSFLIYRDTTAKKLSFSPVFNFKPSVQQQLDSLSKIFLSLPFYRGLLYNPDNNATLMAVRISQKILDSKERIKVVDEIKKQGANFSKASGLELHYSGLPLIRTVMATQVADEMNLFLLLAFIITGVVLAVLLRSVYAVVFSLLVVMVAVVWALGFIVLMGFKLTLLTGLIPPLVVVIGITNCVYLINKYHIEYIKTKDKNESLIKVIERIGLATLFTNLTAAIGFGVFYFTQSAVLKEFGLVAFCSIAAIFFISVILIPCVYSYLPSPSVKHTRYLEQKALNKILDVFDHLAHNHRKIIFTITAILVILSFIGMTRLTATGYIVYYITNKAKLYTDLKFFETNFNGVMPLEIMIDTKKKGGVLNLKRLNKINELQDTLSTYKQFSRPLSIVEGLKFVTQGYYSGEEKNYRLPNDMEKNFIFTYLAKGKDKNTLLASFIDSTKQTARLSMNVADIGSKNMHLLLNEIEPKVKSILDTSLFKVTLTGTSIIFLEGNHYIIDGLLQSLVLALLLIAVCMGYLFRSLRMVLFSVIPNLIPLFFTAGLMGYFHIPLKPSTVLIYSIAFGIAIDNAIRFLAKYQQELHRHNWNVSKTVSMALHEAGISIIYTSIILFFGFIIFTASSFGGTFYLGLLTSVTLVVAMFNNLILLPALLLTLQKWVDRKTLKQRTLADDINEIDVR